MIFIDSNIVIDLIEGQSAFSAWSRAAVARAKLHGRRVVNVVVIAESAGHFHDCDDQLNYFAAIGIEIEDMPAQAAYRSGLAHLAYRRAGGERASVLSDFLIGGHAASAGATLLTRDRTRFSRYFPELALITPETHPNG